MAIIDYLNGNTASLDAYTRRIQRTILRDLQAARATAFLVHRFSHLAIGSLCSYSGFQEIAARIVSGRISLAGGWGRGTGTDAYKTPHRGVSTEI
jgi:hypothetical protein